MEKTSKIIVLGSNGMVGSAIYKQLQLEGCENVVGITHQQRELDDEVQTKWLFRDEQFDYVFQCAALVGGLFANSQFPVEFYQQNARINANVLKYAHETNVKKVMILGSSCIYPKRCKQPITESELLSGRLETSNEMYALAKISTIKLAQAYCKEYGCNYISVMPCSLIGSNDNFDPNTSHFIPGIMKRMDDAKVNGIGKVTIMGTGTPRREFLYVNDFAEMAVWLMNNYDSPELINIGSGVEYSIAEIAEMIKGIVGYEGKLVFDKKAPNGTMRKLLDVSKMNALGLSYKTELKEAIEKLYEWYIKNNDI